LPFFPRHDVAQEEKEEARIGPQKRLYSLPCPSWHRGQKKEAQQDIGPDVCSDEQGKKPVGRPYQNGGIQSQARLEQQWHRPAKRASKRAAKAAPAKKIDVLLRAFIGA
jgi:hypothetical protein